MDKKIEFKREDLGDGVIYEGEIENGSRFVFGKYSFQDISYIGEFNEESDMEGMGKLSIQVSDDGKRMIHTGEFKGKGENGLPLLNGYGEVYFIESSGKIVKQFEGQFVDGKQHGQGKTYFEDGAIYTGEFEHGILHGKGTLLTSDGKILLVKYENGKAVETIQIN